MAVGLLERTSVSSLLYTYLSLTVTLAPLCWSALTFLDTHSRTPLIGIYVHSPHILVYSSLSEIIFAPIRNLALG